MSKKDLKQFATVEYAYRAKRWQALGKKQAKPVRSGKALQVPAEIRQLNAEGLRQVIGKVA